MMKNFSTWLKWKYATCLNEEFDGDNAPVIRGSALGAMPGEEKWEEKL